MLPRAASTIVKPLDVLDDRLFKFFEIFISKVKVTRVSALAVGTICLFLTTPLHVTSPRVGCIKISSLKKFTPYLGEIGCYIRHTRLLPNT